MEILKPTNDYVFKKIFGQKKNKDILKDLLEAILTDIKIKNLKLRKDVTLERKLINNKLGILDITAILNDDTDVNIEMQVANEQDIVDRSLFYWAGLHHESLMKKEKYTSTSRTICICILNYNEFDDGPFHEIVDLRRRYNNLLLTNKLELHYIQLPKFREKCKVISSKLEEWLTFISTKSLEEIKMIDNKYVKQAAEELEYLTGDEETRRLAELREKAIRDEISARERAIRLEKEEIAKKMLAKELDIDLIIEITGLTKREIENL